MASRTKRSNTSKSSRSEEWARADGLVAATHIRGARMHNLRDIDCRIPLRRVTVISGVSGSGKSTLAFDVLYAEGQRRFVECLSAYARQFMERLDRPRVEAIGHIQPPVAFRQRTNIKNARSTVGSITELSDHIRLLFVHAGEASCLKCGGPTVSTDVPEALAALERWPAGTKLAIVSPLDRLPLPEQTQRLQRLGYTRLLIDGRVIETEDWLKAKRQNVPGHSTAAASHAGVIVDRIVAGQARRSRLADAFKAAWTLGGGVCEIVELDGERSTKSSDKKSQDVKSRDVREPHILRQGFSCQNCGAQLVRPSPGLFSWNSPLGACSKCQGFGRVITIDRDKVVPDARKNLRNHAIAPFSVPSARGWYRWLLREARAHGIPTDVPFRDLTPAQKEWVFTGKGDFPGVAGYFEYLDSKRYKMHVRVFVSRFRGYVPCPECNGSRLRPEALAFRVGGLNIRELHELPIEELQAFFHNLHLPAGRRQAVRTLLATITERLACLGDLGVGYLTLARTGRTLSSGETQRIRLAAALGSALTDTLFILDEPTVGLHAHDTAAMAAVLRRLADAGNTVVVIEHDSQVIELADHLIVLGPGGGRDGGRLIYEGPPAAFLQEQPDFFVGVAAPARSFPAPGAAERSARSRATRGGLARGLARAKRLTRPWDADAVMQWRASHAVGATAAPPLASPSENRALIIRDASEHNLQIPELAVPLHGLCVVTGVSGSGKSTLLDEIIHRNWLRKHGRPVEAVGRVAGITGLDLVKEAHFIGQEPLGRSSRSNPISFVKAYAEIRELLAGTLAARQRGLAAGAFSFNIAGGRCDACHGMGTQVLEMYFLPDVEVTCEMCRGKRFRPEVLEVGWRGKNIAEILEMTVDEASEFFRDEPRIVGRLSPLREVGLGYILLGQSTATLSTGEAQRLRLASFLAQGDTREHHLFLFDEPTTGLHAKDIGRLLGALRALCARGHGVIAVEHQLDFICAADWVVDLGPGSGKDGGRVIHAGKLSGLLRHETSLTAQELRAHLARIASWRE